MNGKKGKFWGISPT